MFLSINECLFLCNVEHKLRLCRPRPLQIQYSIESAGEEPLDQVRVALLGSMRIGTELLSSSQETNKSIALSERDA